MWVRCYQVSNEDIIYPTPQLLLRIQLANYRKQNAGIRADGKVTAERQVQQSADGESNSASLVGRQFIL